MKAFGKHTQDVVDSVVNAFAEPETLPQRIANVFIKKEDKVNGKRSFLNQFIVAMQAPSGDARGFKQWQEVGRTVNKGAKAVWILAPCIVTDKKTDEKRLIGFRSIPVFKFEDTSGEALPEPIAVDRLPLFEVAKAWGINVTTYNGASRSYAGAYIHNTSSETIALGVTNETTWLHELAHASDKRLGTLTVAKGQQVDNEIVAELASSVLATIVGVEADLGGAYEYIKSYVKTEDPYKACKVLFDRVCAVVDNIMSEANSTLSLTR